MCIQKTQILVFELRNSSGLVIDDTTHLLIPGKQKICCNFDVPLGNDFQVFLLLTLDYIEIIQVLITL